MPILPNNSSSENLWFIRDDSNFYNCTPGQEALNQSEIIETSASYSPISLRRPINLSQITEPLVKRQKTNADSYRLKQMAEEDLQAANRLIALGHVTNYRQNNEPQDLIVAESATALENGAEFEAVDRIELLQQAALIISRGNDETETDSTREIDESEQVFNDHPGLMCLKTLSDLSLENSVLIEGTKYWSDQGRFPLRSPNDSRQRAEEYRISTIRVEKPTDSVRRGEIETYLNNDDSYRKAYKSDRMEVKLLSEDDKTSLGMPLVKIKSQVGVVSTRAIGPHEFLGIYEGSLIINEADLRSRLEHMNQDTSSNCQDADDQLQNSLYKRSWDLPPIEGQNIPIVSAGSSRGDQYPIGCMLNWITPAYRIDAKGRLSYNKIMNNVKAVSIQTHRAKRRKLSYDMVAYYSKKSIPKGAFLCMDAGLDMLSKQNDMRDTH